MVPSEPERDCAKGMRRAATSVLFAASVAKVWGQEAAQASVSPVTFTPLFAISWNLTANARSGDRFEVTLNLAQCPVARLEKAKVQAHRWHILNIADYVELTGTDVKTGEQCRERVMPGE